MNQLDVFMGEAFVGSLREHGDGSMTFAYDESWLARADASALSPELPLGAGELGGEAALAYFDNLLPEGGIRDFAARAAGVSPGNVFRLLERFGGDTAGALSLLPQGQKPSPEARYLPVTNEAIREWFASSRGIPLDLAGGTARMSLSGAQDKMTVFIDAKGGIAIPLGDAPSSHIIKPSTNQRSPLPQTAVNEALVMRLAAAAGLDAPEVRYEPDLDAVVIARYDRLPTADGRLLRLHQNDLCQILGVAPGRKYESEGGPTLAACFSAVMRHSAQPALDKKRLLEWVAFNVAVGNMDSHAKNLSMLASDGRTRLAPFYDLVCTTVYEHLSKRFAFRIGGENRPGWMMERHWEGFAAETELKPQFVRKVRQNMCEKIEYALPTIAGALRETVKSPEGLSMIDRVEAEIRRSVRQTRMRLNPSSSRA
jgi:serine/threonine-protein kinase HipA